MTAASADLLSSVDLIAVSPPAERLTACTRRAALARGGSALAAAALAATALRAPPALAQAGGDAAILTRVARLEQLAVFLYTAADASGALDPALAETARLFRDHEQQHADGLAAAVEALGGRRPEPPADAAAAERALSEFGVERTLAAARTPDDFLRLALELESTTVAAYQAAVEELQDAKLMQTAVSIMAADGQHLVVLREALGDAPVPRALESAREPVP